MPDGQVVFEITGDSKPVMQSIDDTTAAIQKETKKWDQAVVASTDDMTKSMTKAFDIERVKNWGLKLGEYLVKFGAQAIQAASDLQEVQNVVDVTFGSSAEQINSWAKNAQTQFGLTETQAKRFTSTLGAMMKSAGLDGQEIVKMSEDLAGLAADMASFYNMDFETAFQKIRSGISGETEPLKQLGINLSVANMEAYALTQGITKSFEKMSQGEQTLLRYQYLMQATADAQGDFARTSDSYANSVRKMETALTSIQTSLGTLLLPTIQQITTSFAEFLEKLAAPAKTTALDDFAAIDLDTQKKLDEINKTMTEAQALKDTLESLGSTSAGGAMEAMAKGANALNASAPGTWEGLLGALQSIDGLENIFSNNNAGDNVTALAKALSGASPDTNKAAAWNTFLSALSGNVDALTALTGTGADETAAWLSEIATAANSLDPDSAEGWNELLANFVTGLPGLADTEGGKAFFDAISQNFLAMGQESEEAKAGLLALGWSTDDISERQKEWLDVCKRLVSTIPGLSSVINTETGEITGGISAIEEYVKAWAEGEKRITLIQAQESKRRALAQKYSELPGLEVDMMVAQNRVEQQKKQLDELREKLGLVSEGYELIVKLNAAGRPMPLTAEEQAWNTAIATLGQLTGASEEATAEYERQYAAYEEALKLLEEGDAVIAATYGETNKLTESTTEAAEAMTALQQAASGNTEALNAVKKVLSETEEALKAVSDYQQNVYQDTQKSVQSVVKGFSSIQTPAQQTREKMKDLTSQIEAMNDAAQRGELEKTFKDAENSLPSVQNMTNALQSQLEYMQEYQKELALAKQKGVSADILAMLSDGSQESFDYLYALNHTGGNIEELNVAYKAVQEEAEKFTSALTAQKLTADETFDGLVSKAQEAVSGLNQYDGAKESIEATVQGIVDGLKNQAASVQEQVNNILSIISQLNSAGSYGITGGAIFNMVFRGGGKADGSHANGLDYVPYDGYLALLHQGERVQTAAEAELSRRYSVAQPQSIDYGAMGSAIGAYIPNNGPMQIIWRGRVVADVLSEQQGNSYRALERSGWKS